ncbi:MAG TPA: hypothetical protein VJQ44_03420 [Gemmatimonadales bacterium]|nr:hypothetical protein [Gemmatimonadales bacterium]
MIGCLTAPFRALGCLVVVGGLALGWLYRDQVVRTARGWLERSEAPAVAALPGRPGARALASAKSKVDSLNGWGADSVVLTPSELASLVGDGMDAEVRRQLDSLRVEPLNGELRVRARLRTGRLPSDVVGPLAIALRESEPIEAIGPLRVLRPSVGEWDVRSIRIRDLPLPADVVHRVVAKVLGNPEQESVPIRVPSGVRAIRLTPGTAILYGAKRS